MSQPILVLCRDTRLFWAAERRSSSATSRTTFTKTHSIISTVSHTGLSTRSLDQVAHHAFAVRYPQGTALHRGHKGGHGGPVASHCCWRRLVRQQLLGAVVQKLGALGGQRHDQAAEAPGGCQRGCRSGMKQSSQNRLQQACPASPNAKLDGSTGPPHNCDHTTYCTDNVRHLCCCPSVRALQWSPVSGRMSPAPGGSRPAGSGWSTRPMMKLWSPGFHLQQQSHSL